MAPPNSAASKKAAKAGAKEIPIEKPVIKKTAKKVVSKKSPAAVKKASPLKKIGDKAIKKTMGGAQDNLEGGAKASAAFDLEAFVKVKFSELEKTADQKKVSQILLSQLFNSMFQNVSGRTNSTVAELSKFNMRAANEHYMVKKEDSRSAQVYPEQQEKS